MKLYYIAAVMAKQSNVEQHVTLGRQFKLGEFLEIDPPEPKRVLPHQALLLAL
jgi:hypothetical protein